MNNTLEHFNGSSDFEIKRNANIARLKTRYNQKLTEYYNKYQVYLINYFSPSNSGVTQNLTKDNYTFTQAKGKNTFLKAGITPTPGPSMVALSKFLPIDSADYVNNLERNKAACREDGQCMGFDSLGNYFKGGTLVSSSKFPEGRAAVLGDNYRSWKKNTTETVAGGDIPTMGELERLKSELDTILANLRTNIDSTDSKLIAEADELEKKRDEILERNKQIVMQGKSLDLMNLKLVSRERQNEFSIERNRYRRIMIVVLVVCNLILMGYFGFLLTKK